MNLFGLFLVRFHSVSFLIAVRVTDVDGDYQVMERLRKKDRRNHCVVNVGVSLNVQSGNEELLTSETRQRYDIVVTLSRLLRSSLECKHRWLKAVLAKSRNENNINNASRSLTRSTVFPRIPFLRAVAWIGSFSIIVILITSRLYSHMVTVDPCQQAQESLYKIQAMKLSSPQGDKLPKIIHQQWMAGDVPNKDNHRRFGDWHAAWQVHFPPSEGYTHMLWTDEKLLEFMKENYAWFLPTYESYNTDIQRIDASRYFLLHHYGGLYADMDYEPLSAVLWNFLAPDRVSLLESPYKFNERIQNALMASPPGHLFWNTTFEQLVVRSSENVMGSTGPRFLDGVVQQVPPSYTFTLPCENFQRIPDIANGVSPWSSMVLQHFVAPAYPQKRCGQWEDRTNCQYGRHHNSATWITQESWCQSFVNWAVSVARVWSS
jgi:Glycosyltransferase sugar-binding region containing DXD motif